MVDITRRDLMISAAVGALAAPRTASAAPSDYPNKNIQFVVPYAPGGGFDIYVRAVTPVMEKYLPRKVSIVPLNVASIESKPRIARVVPAVIVRPPRVMSLSKPAPVPLSRMMVEFAVTLIA